MTLRSARGKNIPYDFLRAFWELAGFRERTQRIRWLMNLLLVLQIGYGTTSSTNVKRKRWIRNWECKSPKERVLTSDVTNTSLVFELEGCWWTITQTAQSSEWSLLMDSRMSDSAAGDRGVMIHLKGTGCVLRQSDFSFVFTCMWFPYDSKPLVNSGLSLMTFPWSSTGGLMS